VFLLLDLKKGYPFVMKAQSFLINLILMRMIFLSQLWLFLFFSTRAADALRDKMSSQMTFYPAKIDVNGSLYEVFAGVVLNRKRVFERVGDYEIRIRDGVVMDDEDFIVRDLDNPQFFFLLRSLCDSCVIVCG
jgi:hypothetical protein